MGPFRFVSPDISRNLGAPKRKASSGYIPTGFQHANHLQAGGLVLNKGEDEDENDDDEGSISDLSSLGQESGTLGTERSRPVSLMYGQELGSLLTSDGARGNKAVHAHEDGHSGLGLRAIYCALFVINFVVYTAIAVFETTWPRAVLERETIGFSIFACTVASSTLAVTVKLAAEATLPRRFDHLSKAFAK